MCARFFILIYYLVVVASQHTFHSPTTIQHIVVHDEKIFVGAVNRIVQLSLADLAELHVSSTGPVRDSPLCSHDGRSCIKEAVKVDTDNHNQILHIAEDGLLACGSVKQGICQLLSLSDLSVLSSGDIPVASNSPNAPTVWFAPSPGRLVVAATPAIDSPYRDPFPAVAIREAPDYMVANSGSLEGEAAVFLRAEFRHSLPVRYVSVFFHQHFVYVAAVQPKRIRGPKITKLIRFCNNDTRLVSYSEIELQCRSEENANYPIITSALIQGDRLIASFSDATSTRSAICAFSMQRLKLTFWYNIDRCRGGSDSIGLPHIGRDAKCHNKSRVPLDEDTCELGVGGSIEAVEVAAVETDAEILSTAAVDGVLMAGTADGSVIMMKWKDASQLEEYARRRPLEAAAMGTRIEGLTIAGDRVLVRMPNGLSSLPLSSCGHLTSCSQCLLASDPLCQWCHSRGHCGSPSDCQGEKTSICPLEDGPSVPSRMSVGSDATVFLPVRHLPQPSGFKYECLFGSTVSPASWSEMGVSCSPSSDSRHFSFESKGAELLVPLTLRTSLSKHEIVRFNFTFYDCGRHSTCASCSSSNLGCDWCAAVGKCSQKGKCNGDASSECARISTFTSLRIANGAAQQISVPFSRLDLLPKKSDISCRILLNGRWQSAGATVTQDSVKCQPFSLNFNEKKGNISVPFEILAGNNLVDSTEVTLFDCSLLASDCSSCSVLDPLWDCRWCSGRCAHQCEKKTEECDRPQILRFYPTSGPVEGGTLVTIIGRDLGSSIDDVAGKVYVAGSPCRVEQYHISTKIVCRVEKGSSSGPVRVSVGRAAKRSAESSQFFSFVDVGLFGANPLWGPVSGGTKINFHGQHLNAGSNISITVGDVPCQVQKHRNSSSALSCVVGRAASVHRTSGILLRLDGAGLRLATPFDFRPDPAVSMISPMTSFRSGGRTINVEGSNFDSVQSFRMFLLSSTLPPFEIVSELAPCQYINATLITCQSPRLLYSQKSDANYGRYPVGFAMDNVTSLTNLGHRIQMKIVPDPQFVPFKGIRVHQGDQPLILDGNFLGDAAEPNDYKIFIGSDRCYVTLVDTRQLVCSGPPKQPMATDQQGRSIEGGLPLVTVTVGRVRAELGLIEYASPLATIKLWALVLATTAALFIVLVLLILLWKRRTRERERDYKKIQLQMENLESNVRNECKQAFAELQTSMSFGNNDDYEVSFVNPLREFVSRLLWFEGLCPSTALYASTLPLTMAQFDSLLSNKHFVFALVESAESDPSMSPTEKTLLCSLLSEALLRNFHYYTEVVVDLLRAHIAKTVQAHRSEILFRQSDSVVEKLLSYWLTIAVHPEISDDQAHKYYRMYKALKFQTERGPVDAVTGSARYTLNEAKLLRETVDTSNIDCLVMDLNARGPYMVRANACDTVTQLQQKVLDTVYKNTTHSQRPATHHFELEWQCPRRGNILLHDLDDSPKKGAKRLNTLAMLGIPNGALILMVPAGDRDTGSGGDSGQSSWSSLGRVTSSSLPADCVHLATPTRTIDRRKKIDENIPKNIPEVYLTRLLTSKGTVQKFIDEFLESVLFLEDSNYPPVLKFVFDLLDDEAARNGVPPGLAHQWKCNAFVVRLWAGLITRPALLCDVTPSPSVDSNLTVIAQTLADCFSSSEPIMGLHAPSSRLLFAKDVTRLRPLAVDLLKRISRLPTVNQRQLAENMTAVAKELSPSGSTFALSELLAWVRGNGLRLVSVLSSHQDCVAQRLPQRLAQVVNLSLESREEHIYCTISDYSQ